MEKLKLGKYKHYKGGIYEVLGVVMHSETLEEMVLYKSLLSEDRMWVRPLSMFFETIEVEKKVLNRFEFIE